MVASFLNFLYFNNIVLKPEPKPDSIILIITFNNWYFRMIEFLLVGKVISHF